MKTSTSIFSAYLCLAIATSLLSLCGCAAVGLGAAFGAIVGSEIEAAKQRAETEALVREYDARDAEIAARREAEIKKMKADNAAAIEAARHSVEGK